MRYPDSVKVAIAQAASVIMDRDASAYKACDLIRAAGEEGAQILVFPEAFITGYPRGLYFESPVGSRGPKGHKDFARYWRNSVSIPDETTSMIGEAVRSARLYVVLGVIEQDFGGTLYCTTLYYGPDGSILGKHRKLKPTGLERLIWGEGDGSTLTTVETPFGIMGGLTCWENYMLPARWYMYLKGVKIYIAPTADARDTWQSTLQHIACEGRCFVLAANQFVTKDMYPSDLACYDDLKDQPAIMCRGGSAILNPFGEYVVEPVYGKEKMLYATLDLKQIGEASLDFDSVGHYARSDVFQLLVNEAAHKPPLALPQQAEPHALNGAAPQSLTVVPPQAELNTLQEANTH